MDNIPQDATKDVIIQALEPYVEYMQKIYKLLGNPITKPKSNQHNNFYALLATRHHTKDVYQGLVEIAFDNRLDHSEEGNDKKIFEARMRNLATLDQLFNVTIARQEMQKYLDGIPKPTKPSFINVPRVYIPPQMKKNPFPDVKEQPQNSPPAPNVSGSPLKTVPLPEVPKPKPIVVETTTPQQDAFFDDYPSQYFYSRNPRTIEEVGKDFVSYILPLPYHNKDLVADVRQLIQNENRKRYGLGWFGEMKPGSIHDLLTNMDTYVQFVNANRGFAFFNQVWIADGQHSTRIQQIVDAKVNEIQKRYQGRKIDPTRYQTYQDYLKLIAIDPQEPKRINLLLQSIQGQFNLKDKLTAKEVEEEIIRVFDEYYLPLGRTGSTLQEDIRITITKESEAPYGLSHLKTPLASMTDMEYAIEVFRSNVSKEWNYYNHFDKMKQYLSLRHESYNSVINNLPELPTNPQDFRDFDLYYISLEKCHTILEQNLIRMELIRLLQLDAYDKEYQGICFSPNIEFFKQCEELQKYHHSKEVFQNVLRILYNNRKGYSIHWHDGWFKQTFLKQEYSWSAFVDTFKTQLDTHIKNVDKMRKEVENYLLNIKPPEKPSMDEKIDDNDLCLYMKKQLS